MFTSSRYLCIAKRFVALRSRDLSKNLLSEKFCLARGWISIVSWSESPKRGRFITTSLEWGNLFDTVSVFNTSHVHLVEIAKENNSAIRVPIFFRHRFLQINKNTWVPTAWRMINSSNNRLYAPWEPQQPDLNPQNLKFIVHNIRQNLERNIISNIHAYSPMLAGLSLSLSRDG